MINISEINEGMNKLYTIEDNVFSRDLKGFSKGDVVKVGKYFIYIEGEEKQIRCYTPEIKQPAYLRNFIECLKLNNMQ